MISTSCRIYVHASKDRGLHEVPGEPSNPRIKFAIKMSAPWLDPDDSVTAWCGCIRGLWGLETSTGVPADHYRAASWMGWGQPVTISEAQEGDTVILRRPGGKHVALFEKWQGDDFVQLFGGNQSNGTNSKAFRKTDIIGIRRLLLP